MSVGLPLDQLFVFLPLFSSRTVHTWVVCWLSRSNLGRLWFAAHRYYRQKCVEKFCGADLDRLKRQLDRLRAMYRHAEATKIAQDVVRNILLPRWSDAMEMVDALKSVPVEASHVEEASSFVSLGDD